MKDRFNQLPRWVRDASARYARATTVPTMVGVVMLALIALLYLGPHASRFWGCGFDQLRSIVSPHHATEECWADSLDRLRQDGTAAAILLAIAAAFPISTWRSDAQPIE